MKTHICNIASILVRIIGLVLALAILGSVIDVTLFFAGKLNLADFLFANIGDYILMDVVMTVLFLLFLPLSIFYMWEKDYSPLDNLDVLLLLSGNFVAIIIWWLMETGKMEIAMALIYLIMMSIANVIITLIRAFQPFKGSEKTFLTETIP